MINSFLVSQIKKKFPFAPTNEQEMLIDTISQFLVSSLSNEIFVLRGYAGTGKTSLVGALVRAMEGLHQRTVLMAPTGRAAKVFSNYSGYPAFTIHKRIYRQKSILNNTCFTLNENLHKHTLFIVDEASMIANEGLSGNFGSGRLLDDLIQYVYSGDGCRLLLLGDVAQLPPVGEPESSALSAACLAGYGLQVKEFNLTQVMRQLNDSGILFNATKLRQAIGEEQTTQIPVVTVTNYADVKSIDGGDLIEELNNCYSQAGMEETIVICRSNKRANIYNNGIRARILNREDELNQGDLLMIVKNNYYWTELRGKEDTSLREKMDFIANGDVAMVRRVKRMHELYGFRFATVELVFPDYEDIEMETIIMLDTLQSESPALTKAENDRFFEAVMEDYAEVRQKREKMKRLRANPFYNALQVKYAYAITCHKAQGGQWKRVFLDKGFIPTEQLTSDFYRWLYTAFTRASEKLYLVNWKEVE